MKNKISINLLREKDCKQLGERSLNENTVFNRDAKKGMKHVAVIQHNALLHPYFTMFFSLNNNHLEYPTVTHQSEVGMSCRSAFRRTQEACCIPSIAVCTRGKICCKFL